MDEPSPFVVYGVAKYDCQSVAAEKNNNTNTVVSDEQHKNIGYIDK